MQMGLRLFQPQLMPTLRATYRLQLTPDFGFADAAALASRLAALGGVEDTARTWTGVFTGSTFTGGGCAVRDLWRTFPVALLERTSS